MERKGSQVSARRLLYGGLLLVVLLGVALALGVARDPVEEILHGTGTIEATEIRVSFKISGRIAALAVKEGEAVAAGQVIARLEDAELQAAVARDRATVAAAEARLAELLAGSRDQEIEAARAAVAQAAATLETARRDWTRYEGLYAEGAVSSEQRDAAWNRVEVAREQHKAAQERLNLLVAGARAEAITAARWEVERAKASLRASEITLAESVIRAPSAGVILNKTAERGEMLLPGVPLVILADVQDLWLRVYIPENEIGKVRLGQQARVAVDSFPGRVFSGQVSEIATKAEFTPKTVQTKKERVNLVFGVKIALESTDGLLKPGMPADAEILVGRVR